MDLEVDLVVCDVATSPDLGHVVAGHDLVVSAVRPPDGDERALVSLTASIVEAAQETGIPFIVVGGAASLVVPGTGGHTVLTAPGFLPDPVVPIATACQRQFEWIAERLASNGTYLCPPAMLTPGTRTGSYHVGDDTLVIDDAGNSHISMEDFAVAVLDEAEHPSHTGSRFTVGA